MRHRPRQSARRFAGDEAGSFVVFSLFVFLAMLMITGIAVDFMRNENVRVHLQNTVDRSILAAADLEQVHAPEQVVQSYFEKAGLGAYLDDVEVTETAAGRRVAARASAQVPSMFLRLVGIETLAAPAAATASEVRSDIEISLVLDISGSMKLGGKMANLHAAGREFIDTVLDPTARDRVSVSLVPYTAQVNVGPALFSVLNTRHVHNFSHCVVFDDVDFLSPAFDIAKTYEQAQHFEWSTMLHEDHALEFPGCPQEEYERVVVHSQDADLLKATIAQYQPRANTSMHIGMKWGAALLDPSFRPITEALSAVHGAVDPAFRARPAAYEAAETKKFIVLMTDGENVDSYRIQDWAYDSTSEIIFWARHPLWWYLMSEFPGEDIQQDFYEPSYTAAQANANLDQICSAAKAEGITIYTVGFELRAGPAGILRDCATSPNHFFRVEGIEITSAFEAIARDIEHLKLIQ